MNGRGCRFECGDNLRFRGGRVARAVRGDHGQEAAGQAIGRRRAFADPDAPNQRRGSRGGQTLPAHDPSDGPHGLFVIDASQLWQSRANIRYFFSPFGSFAKRRQSAMMRYAVLQTP